MHIIYYITGGSLFPSFWLFSGYNRMMDVKSCNFAKNNASVMRNVKVITDESCDFQRQ